MEEKNKQQRVIAVQRFKGGESPESICTSLGNSRSWLYKWIGRHLENDDTWSETRVINLLHFETLIATKAARCVLAADGKADLVDFGLRRAHGAEAGLLAARDSYIAGFAGTSNVLAAAHFGIPVFGTMAHKPLTFSCAPGSCGTGCRATPP